MLASPIFCDFRKPDFSPPHLQREVNKQDVSLSYICAVYMTNICLWFDLGWEEGVGYYPNGATVPVSNWWLYIEYDNCMCILQAQFTSGKGNQNQSTDHIRISTKGMFNFFRNFASRIRKNFITLVIRLAL